MKISVDNSRHTSQGLFTELFTGNRKAFILILLLGAELQLCGSQAIVCNSKLILEQFTNGGLDSDSANILMGCIQFVAALVASSVVDYFGRRPLLLVGVLVTAICNAVIAAYFWAVRMDYNVTELGWLPMMMLFVYIISYVIGLNSVFTVLLGEWFSKDVRAFAAALATMNATFIAAVVSKLFQVFCDEIGKDFTFAIFSVCSLIAFGYFWKRMPETKGMSLDAIQWQFHE